ncbi:hypothetical protein LZ554_008915 [Drepanopeziza brunnea f. sp. 'monogermtubi']|nr:hypothetical protein LZ554_008915 [Drepanopeziza brunnea f. sp. 'monogermtubi']
MSDRYRYSRPRSPPLLNVGRTSLPINISGWATPSVQVHEHLHVVPSSRREVIPGPRSSTGSVAIGGTITTTYKVKTEPAVRGSSVREGSRTRRSTVDTHSRPTVVTTTTRHRPVIHSSGATRPDSPLKNTYRGGEEEYVTVPATSRHGLHHTKRYSATMDNADMSRLAREREASRLHVVPVREPAYTSTRTRSTYPVVSRHADTNSDDYGEEGYGYTNPRDLVQYDLSNNPIAHQRSRRDSFGEGRSSRPTSITGYGEVVPRSYETRERGPPPTTRGLDRMRTPVYDLPVARRPGSPSLMAPVEPVQRPAAFEPVEPVRRPSASRARPQSMYHENREPHRIDSRGEDYYEIRNDDRRENRSLRHENPVEQRGFGIRDERLERIEKIERPQSRARLERSERGERIERSESRARVDRIERADRPDRPSRSDRPDHDRTDEKEYKEHKGRDALAAGLSIAGAALGVNALKSAARGDRDEREDREEREERKRREEEPRMRRDHEERSPMELGGRQDFPPPPRDMPPPPPPRDAPTREVSPPQAPLNPRDPKERKSSRDERDRESERRERRRAASEAVLNGTAIDSRSDSSASDEFRPRSHREPPARSDPGPAPTPFNPKDTMDLFALKEALKSKESQSTSKVAPEPILQSRTPRGSTTKDLREAAEIRNGLNERRPREPLATTEKDSRQPRVLSPPREKAEDKPVKGILRQPKEKFPEDPAPIREGVAPLKDAKKDGIPPDARWTKISRKLVNPEALEAGKERFEAREDFVIVLRVLSRDEVQGYAEVTQRIRSSREELEAIAASDRRRARRERHERHKRERNGEIPRSERGERRYRRRGDERERRRESDSGSDSTEDDEIYERERERGGERERERERPKMLEAPQKRATFNDALMSGGLGEMVGEGSGGGNWVPVGIGSGGGNGRRER